MIGRDLAFLHLGLAVRNPSKALRYFREIGYSIGPVIVDERRGAQIVFCKSGRMPDVEILSPAPKSSKPLARLIKKLDSGKYHQCYESASIHETVVRLQAAGLSIAQIVPPAPATLFDSRLVSFLHIEGMGLVEVMEPVARAATVPLEDPHDMIVPAAAGA